MGLLDVLALIFLVVWIVGLIFNIVGWLIHIFLIAALILFLLRFFITSE